MTTIRQSAASLAGLLSVTGPAAAHEGAHLHPHGIDTAWIVATVAVVAVAAGLYLIRR